jgi:hypothetical protein
MKRRTKPEKRVECDGAECWAEGNAFRPVEGSCRAGVPASVVRSLTRRAAQVGQERATEDHCKTGCTCAGRFKFTKLDHEQVEIDGEETCVWWVIGFWEGTCERAGEVVSGPGQEVLRRIRTSGEFQEVPPERPEGDCDRRPCRGLAEAHITLEQRPDEGIDGDLFQALVDRAAETARRDATQRCPKGCSCAGEFFVTSSGVERIRPHRRRRWVWWVGGYWSGKCKRFY